MGIKLTERSLYHPMISLLEELGFSGVQEVSSRSGEGIADILAEKDGRRYIFEVKRSGYRSLIGGILQAYRYALSFDTKNLVVVVYPDDSFLEVSAPGEATFAPLKAQPEILCLTENWVKYFRAGEISLEEFVAELCRKIEHRLPADVDMDLVADALREVVRKAMRVFEKYFRKRSIADALSSDIDYFISQIDGSAQGKGRERLVSSFRKTMLPYLLVNQIVFYQVFARSTGRVPELSESISNLEEMRRLFQRIVREINYKPIFSIDVAGKLPPSREAVQLVRDAIAAVNVLRVENLRHDLLGRLFHYLLPEELRRKLSAFYTEPKAADLLAALAIPSWDATVWDPACGSGTLLVAAYRRKLELCLKERGEKLSERELDMLHSLFIEEQLTGTDIMPFATHLTAINLCSQRISTPVRLCRVSMEDSLRYFGVVERGEIREEAGYERARREVDKLERTYRTIDDFVEGREAPVRDAEEGALFHLYKPDVILINPPFTRRERIPESYRQGVLRHAEILRRCDSRADLWCPFLALADALLPQGGVIGAVLPTAFLSGSESQKIRDWILENYSIEYIVLPPPKNSFSEGARYGDFIAVMRKGKARMYGRRVKIARLKKPLREIPDGMFQNLIKKLRTHIEDKPLIREEFEIFVLPEEKLRESRKNLSLALSLAGSSRKLYESTLSMLVSSGLCTNLGRYYPVREGIVSTVRGVSRMFYVTRGLSRSRTKRAALVLSGEREDGILASSGGKTLHIDREHLQPALRTIYGLKRLDASGEHDYIVTEHSPLGDVLSDIAPEELRKAISSLHNQLKSQGKFYVAVPDKANIATGDVHHLAVFSSTPLYLSNSLFGIECESEKEAKILTLSLDTSFTLLQFLHRTRPTLLGYKLQRLSAREWGRVQVLNPKALQEDKKKSLLSTFEEVSKVSVPRIAEQLRERHSYRVSVDRAILDALNVPEEKQEQMLDELYEHLLSMIEGL